MNHRISDKLVRGLEPPPQGNRIVYDDEIKGFGVRITASGARAFVINYRINGRERRGTIGSYPDWSVEAARVEAKEWKRDIDRGIDPLEERETKRGAPTVADLCARYLEDYFPRIRPSSQKRYREIIKADIKPRLGHKKVADVRHGDIVDLHRAITKRGAPIRANRVAALLSRMFSLAVRPWEYRPDNPVKGLERNPENRRTRYLSLAEIDALAKALRSYPRRAAANAVRFILLTGCRPGEAMSATWDQFDLEAGLWIKPSAYTKQKKEHRVPLSGTARQLLQEIRAEVPPEARYVFPGRKPDEPIKQLHTCWQYCVKKAGLKDARLHDLRHTHASILVSAGLSLPMIGELLGHTQPATTARYAHLYQDPLREAVERAAAVIETAGKPPAEVVKIRPDRKP